MSHTGNAPADTAINPPQSEALAKYWCFMCEREFNHTKTNEAEVFCPQCNCISELLETEDDPRSFRPFDARNEANQTTQSAQNTQPNNPINNMLGSGQVNQNTNTQVPFLQANAPIMGFSVVHQTSVGPMRTITMQSVFPQGVSNPMMQNSGNNQLQQNLSQNQPGVPQQNPTSPPVGATLFNPFINNVFGMFNSMFSGMNMQGGLFGEVDSRIIEEFLRNDPNRHGPPPAPEESINKLKKSQFSETCKTKDCSVCQEDYKNGDNLLTMPCDHIFHKDCLEKWLKLHNSCPACRKPLTAPRDSYSENMFA